MTENVTSESAICIGDPVRAKNAALLFDNIWHICPSFESAPSILFPESFRKNPGIKGEFAEYCYNLAFTNPNIQNHFDQAFNIVEAGSKNNSTNTDLLLPNNTRVLYKLIEETYTKNYNGMRDRFLKLIQPISTINPTPVISSPGLINAKNDSVSDISVTLSNLKIIDTEETPWDQIIEFRKDKLSHLSLRRLRLFLYDNCAGKSSSYIEDRILTDIDNYEKAIKNHGFKLIEGAMTTLIDSKNILAVSSAGVAATLIGTPLIGVSTACALEVSSISIKIARDLYARREYVRDHPLTYLIQAKSELEKHA